MVTLQIIHSSIGNSVNAGDEDDEADVEDEEVGAGGCKLDAGLGIREKKLEIVLARGAQLNCRCRDAW